MSNDGTPTWGEGIRVLRGIKGWTQVQLAERAGVAQPTISKLENGSFEASDGTRVRLAVALGVDPNVLFPYLEISEEVVA